MATPHILGFRVSEQRFSQVVVGFVVLGFLVLLAAGAGTAWIVSVSDRRTDWVNHTYIAERHIDGLRLQVARLENARRGYLLDRDPAFRRAYAAVAAEIPGEIDILAGLTADNVQQQRNIAILRSQVAALQAKLDASMAVAASSGDAAVARGFQDDGSVAQAKLVGQTTRTMLAEEERLLEVRNEAQNADVRAFFLALPFSGALLLAVAFGSVLVILRFTRELTQSRNTLRDLNENLEQAVADRTVDLQRANDEIQRFAYIVSHDLRSPLVNVLGFTAELDAASKPLAEMIDRAETEAPGLVTAQVREAVRQDIPEAIDFIRSSTQKMDRLINAILKLSREGRRTISPEPLDMDAMAQGIADSLQHRVGEAGAEIVIEKPLPSITTDRVSLEQILSNLVENAVKYLQPGRSGEVRLRGWRDLGRIVYEVADNGRGIDAKDHERIFDLFRRSGVQDQPGEGIGLAHVRASAHRLGGVVTCESTLGQGSAFRVSLPAIYSGEFTV